jgi:hypothetical protein
LTQSPWDWELKLWRSTELSTAVQGPNACAKGKEASDDLPLRDFAFPNRSKSFSVETVCGQAHNQVNHGTAFNELRYEGNKE